MIVLPITLTVAAAAALINIWLGMRCSRIRISDKIKMGDGGNALLHGRMRAHANFAEYVPIFLILLGLVELADGTGPWLWAAGGLFIAARIAHPFGMDRPAPNPLRMGGIMLTWLLMLLLAGWAVWIVHAGGAAPVVTDLPMG